MYVCVYIYIHIRRSCSFLAGLQVLSPCPVRILRCPSPEKDDSLLAFGKLPWNAKWIS